MRRVYRNRAIAIVIALALVFLLNELIGVFVRIIH